MRCEQTEKKADSLVSNGEQDSVWSLDNREQSVLDAGIVPKNLAPDVLCPVGGDGRDEEGLKLDELADEFTMHTDAGSSAVLAI